MEGVALNDVLMAFVVGLPSTLAALAALIAVLRNGKKVEAMHGAINGRMGELLDVTKSAARAEGVIQGHEEAQPLRRRTDKSDG